MTRAPWELPVSEIFAALAARQVSSVELVEAYLSRIARFDGKLLSFVAVSESALEDARRSDQRRKSGTLLGPLDGIAVAIKDNFAAGFAAAAIGTDTGGSIRIPAALCGTVGLKPTFGLVSRHGLVPHSWSLDHAGPLCRTVEDAAILMEVLAGHDQNDPASAQYPAETYHRDLLASQRPIRFAVCRNYFFDAVTDDVRTAVEKVIDDLRREGHDVVDI